MDYKSGESTEEDDVTDAGTAQTELQRCRDEVDGVTQETGFKEKVKHIERNDQLSVRRML